MATNKDYNWSSKQHGLKSLCNTLYSKNSGRDSTLDAPAVVFGFAEVTGIVIFK